MAGMRKAVYFTLDALFATILIGIALIVASRFFITDIGSQQQEYFSKDIINTLSNIKITEINDTYVKSLILSGEIVNLNNSVIEQIGEFYVINKTEFARNLSVVVSKNLIPSKFGFEVLVNDESVYRNESGSGSSAQLVSSRRLISGIEKFKPIKGATSKVYLEGIKSKKYSSYYYFGGFVGQGNITGSVEDIPAGVNVTSAYLELDSGDDFTFFINNMQCQGTFIAGTITMQADGWDISDCKNHILPGQRNNYTLKYSGDLGNSYVGGGFVRVDYYTDELQHENTLYLIKEPLPKISGIINLYSSFFVPGTLYNLSIYLHYYALAANQTNNTFYFTIGNQTVFSDNNLSGEKIKVISTANISALLNYINLSEKVVPIRAGFENVSFGFIYDGNADVSLITDLSGSMDWKMDSNSGGTARNCNSTSLNSSDSTRLSVAKCLDVQFVSDIINISGNKIGLISFNETTKLLDTINLTTNLTQLYERIGNASPQTGYDATGYTCICCGINSARNMLILGIYNQTFISRGSIWRYNNNSFSGNLTPDSNGYNWYDLAYNDSLWQNGTAILGATNGYSYSPIVVKELGTNLNGQSLYANLWEHGGDNPGPPNDFTSGILNSTGNTFGISGADDGWDRDTVNGSGVFGYDDDIDYNNISGGMLTFDNNLAGGNVCFQTDCSGAYGIKINVTREMFDMMNANGNAMLSFYYKWDDTGNNNYFETCDQVWIKARWTSPTTGQHYLGTDLDSGDTGADADPEIATADNPDTQLSGTYSQDLRSFIEAPGYYYLEIGGKLKADSCNGGDRTDREHGTWSFDNIQIRFSNATDHYYFRKHFTVSNLNDVKRGALSVFSDDRAVIYLNGYMIDDDPAVSHDGKYWNRIGKNVDGSYFVQGDNVISAEIFNINASAKFDLSLIGLNNSRDKNIMVMTDGQANRECSEQGVTEDLDNDGSADTASDDAIQAACDARSKYGITLFAVGYSSEADAPTLSGIAACGGGIYAKSDNITGLQSFYEDVAATIISTSRHSQTIDVTGEGDIAASILYPDSYINISYIPKTEAPQFGEISLIREEKNFTNCTFTVNIPSDIRVSDARLTSYSSEHWTDELVVNGQEVYNLSKYSKDYTLLGDPYIVNIPVSYLTSGNNTFSIRTGDSPENTTGCSLNNTLIYTAQVKASVSYSDVLEKAVGCKWIIEFDDDGNGTIEVPPTYTGAKECLYTNATISYDLNDTYDDAMFNLLDNLDFNDDGRIYVNIEDNNLVVGAIAVGKIPYPWGPAIAEIRVWR